MRPRKLALWAGTVALTVGTSQLASAGDTPMSVQEAPASVQQAANVVASPAATNKAVAQSTAVAVGQAAAAAAPAATPMSVWSLLGCPSLPAKVAAAGDALHASPLAACIKAKIKDPIHAMLKLKPGLQPVDSPKMAESPVPILAEAAKVKQQEDLVPQKLQAIHYLTTVKNACCYPGVRESLLAALTDCNAEVREAAARAFGQACCCHLDVLKALEAIMNDRDELGYYKEHSAKVRAAAAESYNACVGAVPPPKVKEGAPREGAPREGGAPAKAGAGVSVELPAAAVAQAPGSRWHLPFMGSAGRTQPTRLTPVASESIAPAPVPESVAKNEPTTSAPAVEQPEPPAPPTPVAPPVRPTVVPAAEVTTPTAQNSVKAAESIEVAPPQAEAEDKSVKPEQKDKEPSEGLNGSISYVDVSGGLVQLTFAEGDEPAVGATVEVYHKYLFKLTYLGNLEVVEVAGNRATARPTAGVRLNKLRKGDQIVCPRN